MICPNCKSNIKDHSKFCSVCGTALPVQQQAPVFAQSKPGMQPAYTEAPAGSRKGAAGGLSVQMLQLVTGILWIFPVLAGFLPVIHVSSRLISLDFSLVSLFDGSAWVSQVGGSSLQADVMNQAMGGMKTWMIVLVVLFFVMAVLGIFMGLKAMRGRWRGLYTASSLIVATIGALLMVGVSLSAGSMSTLVQTSHISISIGLSFFGILAVVALFLILACNAWSVWKMAESE